MAKGVVYPNHGRGIERFHRWFISYVDRMGRYTEENFDTKKEAVARMKQLRATQRKLQEGPQLWTRERAMPEDLLR
jgi:hypothetical protein